MDRNITRGFVLATRTADYPAGRNAATQAELMGTKYGRGSIEQTLGNATLDTVTSDSRQARQMARRQRMAETIMAEGAVRIEDIVERFSISLMTAHRGPRRTRQSRLLAQDARDRIRRANEPH